jgi:hypothetical protein
MYNFRVCYRGSDGAHVWRPNIYTLHFPVCTLSRVVKRAINLYIFIYLLFFIICFYLFIACNSKPHSQLFYPKHSHDGSLYSIHTPLQLIRYDIPIISRWFQSFLFLHIIFSGKESSYYHSENLWELLVSSFQILQFAIKMMNFWYTNSHLF